MGVPHVHSLSLSNLSQLFLNLILKILKIDGTTDMRSEVPIRAHCWIFETSRFYRRCVDTSDMSSLSQFLVPLGSTEPVSVLPINAAGV
jgi:hypothetical protein